MREIPTRFPRYLPSLAVSRLKDALLKTSNRPSCRVPIRKARWRGMLSEGFVGHEHGARVEKGTFSFDVLYLMFFCNAQNGLHNEGR